MLVHQAVLGASSICSAIPAAEFASSEGRGCNNSYLNLLTENVNCDILILIFAASSPIVLSVGDCSSQVFIAAGFLQE